jgi:hypothetical protein
VLFGVGGLLFAAATWRAGLFPRLAALAYGLGIVVAGLRTATPLGLDGRPAAGGCGHGPALVGGGPCGREAGAGFGRGVGGVVDVQDQFGIAVAEVDPAGGLDRS